MINSQIGGGKGGLGFKTVTRAKIDYNFARILMVQFFFAKFATITLSQKWVSLAFFSYSRITLKLT